METQRQQWERRSGKKEPTEVDKSGCLGVGEKGGEDRGASASSLGDLERVGTIRRRKLGGEGCGCSAPLRTAARAPRLRGGVALPAS